MTPAEIRAAISADATLLAMVHGYAEQPQWEAVAAGIAASHTEVHSRMVSARGLAERLPGGPLAAELILKKLEGAAAAMQASPDQQQQLMGSLIARQLKFLASDGLDFGSPALRGMLDQLTAATIITADEAAALKAIGQVPANVTEYDVRRAVLADDGTLLV